MRSALLLILLVGCAHPAPQAPKPPPDPHDIPANVDAIVGDVLARTGTPSASVAAIAGGKIVYVHAYGDGRLAPKAAATPQMRYDIGSISKQFTAAELVLLADEGKLSLDDTVGKYVPGLTSGDVVTIREILSHTSGYSDYAPQDYMIPEWATATTPGAILDGWAKRPLDFAPGTKWQYSNTNYVIAGQICEKVEGAPLHDILARTFFSKLGMKSVAEDWQLAPADAQGTFRRAHGPLHAAPIPGRNWLYAAGDLAMTAEDLAAWDVGLIAGTVLTPAQLQTLSTEVRLANGMGTGYALGLSVGLHDGRRQLSHGGEDIGFVAENIVLPDDKLAVVVLTNQDASEAAGEIAGRVRDVLLRAQLGSSLDSERRVRAVLAAFAQGQIDRALFTPDANAYFTPEAISEYASSLAPLGALQGLDSERIALRGGFTYRGFEAKYAGGKAVEISVYETPDGKLEQFLITLE